MTTEKRKTARLRTRQDDHQRILLLLSRNEIPGIRRILEVALRRGASTTAITETLERAINHVYRPRGGYTSRELDIAFLAKCLGGPKLLYALQKSHGFPSLTTLRRHQPIPQLQLSISAPTANDINKNLDAFLDPSITPAPNHSFTRGLPGMTLMIDDIAIESIARYSSSQNAVVGPCREHVARNKVNLELNSYDTITDLKQRLASSNEKEKICMASSATVMVIGSMWRTDHYSPMPMAVSCTDKHETGHELAGWVRVAVDTWQKHKWGASVHGPIWTIATDGDAAFRLAKSLLCLTTKLQPDSPLGTILFPLKGSFSRNL